jgi:inward rectifier potassium channel
MNTPSPLSDRPAAATAPFPPVIHPAPKPGAYRERLEVRRLGFRSHFWEDMYHAMLVTPWWQMLLLFAAVFLAVNLAFGFAYKFTGGVQGADTFWDLFFFSVQTFSTVGYGSMAPVGVPAEAVTTFEAFVGVLVNAFAAGIVVIKFARPTARVMFSNVPVVSSFDGMPTLMVRMANSRANQVFDAQVRMFLLRDVRTREGFAMRRLFDLELTRESSPFFTLTLTAMHPIDERSPLYSLTREQLDEMRAQIIVTIQGVDESFMTQVHARRFYNMADIAWDANFSDVLSLAPDGKLVVDYTRFHDVVRKDDRPAQG